MTIKMMIMKFVKMLIKFIFDFMLCHPGHMHDDDEDHDYDGNDEDGNHDNDHEVYEDVDQIHD